MEYIEFDSKKENFGEYLYQLNGHCVYTVLVDVFSSALETFIHNYKPSKAQGKSTLEMQGQCLELLGWIVPAFINDTWMKDHLHLLNNPKETLEIDFYRWKSSSPEIYPLQVCG